MINGRYLSSLAFLMVSGLGALYLALEALLQMFGASICSGEGCKVVAQYSRFGDLTIILPGLAVMSLLALFAGRGMRSENTLREQSIDYILIAALAAEGFFAGYQVFWIGKLCVFCVSVFGIFATLGFLRVASGHREVIAGFGALAAVLFLFLLLLPPGGTALPQDRRHILFFSPDCKHCAEIKKDLEAAKVEFEQVPIKEYAASLRTLGIDEVPTLFVTGPYEKVFLTGSKAIRRYLASCSAEPAAEAGKKRTAPAAADRRNQPAGQLDLQIFSPIGPPGEVLNAPQDEGLCKEDVKCE